MPSLKSPVEKDLGSCLFVLRHHFDDGLMKKDIWTARSICSSSDRTVGNGMDVILLKKLDHLVLHKERMKLDLVASWRNSGIAKHVP